MDRKRLQIAFFATLISFTQLGNIAGGETTTLAEGTVVDLYFPKSIKACEVSLGDTISLMNKNSIYVRGGEVIKKNAKGGALVIAKTGAGALGTPERIDLQLLYVCSADGSLVPLRGLRSYEGSERFVESLGITSVCCLGILYPGGRVTIKRNSIITGLVHKQIEVDLEVVD